MQLSDLQQEPNKCHGLVGFEVLGELGLGRLLFYLSDELSAEDESTASESR